MKVSLVILSLFVSTSVFAKNGKNYRLTEVLRTTTSSTDKNACIKAQHLAKEKLLMLAENYCNQEGLVLFEDLTLAPKSDGVSQGIEIDHDVIRYNDCNTNSAKIDSEIRFKCVRD